MYNKMLSEVNIFFIVPEVRKQYDLIYFEKDIKKIQYWG